VRRVRLAFRIYTHIVVIRTRIIIYFHELNASVTGALHSRTCKRKAFIYIYIIYACIYTIWCYLHVGGGGVGNVAVCAYWACLESRGFGGVVDREPARNAENERRTKKDWTRVWCCAPRIVSRPYTRCLRVTRWRRRRPPTGWMCAKFIGLFAAARRPSMTLASLYYARAPACVYEYVNNI